jgi:hypothetical protein
MNRSDDEALAHGDEPERSSTEVGLGLTRRRLLAQSAQATAVAAAAAAGIVRPAQAAPSPEGLFLNPFNKLSAHHRPVGLGMLGRDAIDNPDAYYGIPGTTGPATRGRMSIVTSVRLQGPVGLKWNYWVSPTDPYRTIERAFNSLPGPKPPATLPFTCRMPQGVVYPPEPNPPQDCNVFFYPRNGDQIDLGDLFNQFKYNGRTAQHRYSYGLGKLDTMEVADGWGRGTSASKIRWPSCCLRYSDLAPANPGPINHCLNVLATRKGVEGSRHVLGKTRVWPSYGVDTSSSNANENMGDIPYGTRFVIRWQDRGLRDSLGLTARGKVLFDCLLHYGFYVLDGANQGGENGGGYVGFRTDEAPTATGDWPWTMKEEVRIALGKLVKLCWPVRNVRTYSFDNEIHSDGLPYASGGGPLGPGSINTAWDA